MTDAASLTDLRLVLAIDETGSIGGAATLLHLSQPSASQRLAVLERRVGVALVERDTTGARLTPAGLLLAEHGRRALELVAEAVAAARSPAGLRLAVGTIGSLAPVVYPALQSLLAEHLIVHRTDHGRPLVRAVADGALTPRSWDWAWPSRRPSAYAGRSWAAIGLCWSGRSTARGRGVAR
jgi:DNA-binding transcriptional LysR family regulator